MVENLVLLTEIPSIELRQLSVCDASKVFDAIEANRNSGEQHLVKTGVDAGYPNIDAVRRVIKSSFSEDWQMMGIFANDQFVGSIDLSKQEYGPEIGYWLDERYTGKGYATVATKALATYAVQQYGYVIARSDPNNVGSHRVLLRSGFQETDRSERKVFFTLK